MRQEDRGQISNVAASVRARLLNRSRAQGEDFGLLLSRFAIERLLYRLSVSAHREAFVLKGAALLLVWPEVPRRPTRDLDFLGIGDPSAARLEAIFRELCKLQVLEDGLALLPESVSIQPIREEARYGGQRIRLEARLGEARIPMQIDVGFGDTVTPAAREGDYPTLLELPAPRLKLYPLETVVAEKWQAMVELGEANSRMKDFYDIWILSSRLCFDGSTLSRAIAATFERRQTPLPASVPVALRDEFSRSAGKQTQWNAFVRRSRLEDVPALPEVTLALQDFLWPVTQAARSGSSFTKTWQASLGWE